MGSGIPDPNGYGDGIINFNTSGTDMRTCWGVVIGDWGDNTCPRPIPLPCLILAPQIKKLSMNAPSCLIQTAILRNEFKKKNWPSKELVVKWFEPFKKLIIFNQVYLSKIMNR